MVEAYVGDVYIKFWGSSEILSDNGLKSKNQLSTDVVTQLGVKHSSTPLLTILSQTK